jgi:hypothetical protein
MTHLLVFCLLPAGVFSARNNTLVKLPWSITACPAAGKKIVTSVVILSQPAGSTACPKAPPAPKPLALAAAGEVAKTEKCLLSTKKGYTVFRVNIQNGRPGCYMMRAVLSDGRQLSGTLQVLAR